MLALTFERTSRTAVWAGLALCCAAPAPAWAETRDGVADEAGKGPAVEISPVVGHVTVSRAGDALGRPVYAARSAFSGAVRMVGFSTTPPAAAATGSGLARPFTGALPDRLPLAATALTSGFGYRRHPLLGRVRAHSGVDLAAPVGTPVMATSDGTVGAAGWHGGYGLLVSLEGPDAVETRYGHLSQVAVTPGQRIRKGEVLGYVGSTGLSTGPHLHYEVRVNGRAIDPLRRPQGKTR
jgi:murein DD-endopeptidase MepM/ murein hydrolase activator NlpD